MTRELEERVAYLMNGSRNKSRDQLVELLNASLKWIAERSPELIIRVTPDWRDSEVAEDVDFG